MTFAIPILRLTGWLVLLTLVAGGESKPASNASKQQTVLADRAAQKLAYIQRNGMKASPDQKPTVLTDDELNAYFADGRVKLPVGVKKVRYQAQPGTVTVNTQVDFDEVRAGQKSSNPLLGIFSGVHDVEVVAHGTGNGGIARVQVESAAIDGVTVPRFVLEMFVDKVLKPKYPKAALDTDFKMPARVDTAALGEKKLTLTQK